MNVNGRHYRTIWLNEDGWSVDIIDQTRLPHAFSVVNLRNLDDACRAIRDMLVRGAPLIGATAAFGMYLALRQDASDSAMAVARQKLLATRPTAVNLRWALDQVMAAAVESTPEQRAANVLACSQHIADADVAICRAIGGHGLEIIRQCHAALGDDSPVNILTHCNAGWLATVDWGTATAPIYMAHDEGIPIHVWVDETRPRNQGASLTAWELGMHGVPHTVIVDNAGGHLMQNGDVDLCFVGTDRTTRNGDVCNKIGTYLKALAARDNNVPFYVCLPSTTIDWRIEDGLTQIPIEMRDESEVLKISGALEDGGVGAVSLTPSASRAANPAFDVTPARLVTGLVTERGTLATEDLVRAFPELARGMPVQQY